MFLCFVGEHGILVNLSCGEVGVLKPLDITVLALICVFMSQLYFFFKLDEPVFGVNRFRIVISS